MLHSLVLEAAEKGTTAARQVDKRRKVGRVGRGHNLGNTGRLGPESPILVMPRHTFSGGNALRCLDVRYTRPNPVPFQGPAATPCPK